MKKLLQGGQLIRNLKLENRIQYHEEKKQKLIKEGKNTEEFVIIIMEYPKEMGWSNICIVGRRSWPANRLQAYAKKYLDKPD